MLYPMKLKAPLKDYIWGGHRLVDEYGKESSLDRVAESWELSCHQDGVSVIENGDYSGMLLTDYFTKAGKSVWGSNAQKFDHFPILIKLIDAHDNLSVQVHPDNEYALRVEGEYGKTEMWYIVDCEPDSSLIYGFQQEVSKEDFARKIQENTLLDIVNRVPVKKGDVFFIEAGTLHAIGKGIVIAEIQQNSNTTYRVYDYGRVGADGKPRQLHVEKALEVTQLSPPSRKPQPMGDPQQKEGFRQTLLATCEYFTVRRLEVELQAQLCADEASFHSLLVLEGEFHLSYAGGELSIEKGNSVWIPAGMGDYTLKGTGTVLWSNIE